MTQLFKQQDILKGKMHHSNHCTCHMRLWSEAWHDFLAEWEWDQ